MPQLFGIPIIITKLSIWKKYSKEQLDGPLITSAVTAGYSNVATSSMANPTIMSKISRLQTLLE